MVAVLEETRPQIAELCRKYGVRRLDVFGSAASAEDFDTTRSDFDFLVEYPPNHQFGPWLSEYIAFKQALEEVLDRPVDLVMSTAPRNPYFIREMQRTRQCLYAA